jgi:hypothetical protein
MIFLIRRPFLAAQIRLPADAAWAPFRHSSNCLLHVLPKKIISMRLRVVVSRTG